MRVGNIKWARNVAEGMIPIGEDLSASEDQYQRGCCHPPVQFVSKRQDTTYKTVHISRTYHPHAKTMLYSTFAVESSAVAYDNLCGAKNTAFDREAKSTGSAPGKDFRRK